MVDCPDLPGCPDDWEHDCSGVLWLAGSGVHGPVHALRDLSGLEDWGYQSGCEAHASYAFSSCAGFIPYDDRRRLMEGGLGPSYSYDPSSTSSSSSRRRSSSADDPPEFRECPYPIQERGNVAGIHQCACCGDEAPRRHNSTAVRDLSSGTARMVMGGSERSVQIQIAGGEWRGVLELNVDGGGWQAVCNDGFDSAAATAFCRELGYLSGAEYNVGVGLRSTNFAADDIECPYDASSISVKQQDFCWHRSSARPAKVVC